MRQSRAGYYPDRGSARRASPESPEGSPWHKGCSPGNILFSHISPDTRRLPAPAGYAGVRRGATCRGIRLPGCRNRGATPPDRQRSGALSTHAGSGSAPARRKRRHRMQPDPYARLGSRCTRALRPAPSRCASGNPGKERFPSPRRAGPPAGGRNRPAGESPGTRCPSS